MKLLSKTVCPQIQSFKNIACPHAICRGVDNFLGLRGVGGANNKNIAIQVKREGS